MTLELRIVERADLAPDEVVLPEPAPPELLAGFVSVWCGPDTGGRARALTALKIIVAARGESWLERARDWKPTPPPEVPEGLGEPVDAEREPPK